MLMGMLSVPSGMKNEKIVHLYPLGTFSAFCFMCFVFLVAITLKLLKISKDLYYKGV